MNETTESPSKVLLTLNIPDPYNRQLQNDRPMKMQKYIYSNTSHLS